MSTCAPSSLCITVRLTGNVAPLAVIAAAEADKPLATWTRGLIEREVGAVPGTEGASVPRVEPMRPDELTRRTAVRRIGEAVDLLKQGRAPPEDAIAELREAAAVVVATLPRRSRP